MKKALYGLTFFAAFLSCRTSAATTDPVSTFITHLESGSRRLSIQYDLRSVPFESVPFDSLTGAMTPNSCIGYTTDPGQPVLPALTTIVVVPPDVGLRLETTASPPDTLPETTNPAIAPVSGFTHFSAQSIADKGLYPPVITEMSAPFVIRGVRLVRITLYPVQFDQSTGRYFRRDQIDAHINYTSDPPVNPATHPIRSNRSQNFLRFIRSYAVNGDVVGRDDPVRDVPSVQPLGHYLIVAHEDLMQYMAPFIEWRRRSGYLVDLMSVPRDSNLDTTWIKRQIQTRYDAYLRRGEDPFDMILLVGDHQNYGDDRARLPLAAPKYGWDYACLEGGANDDHADCAVAQWIAGDRSTIELFTGRTLSYESDPPMDDPRWFRKGAIFTQRWAENWDISLHTNVRWAREAMYEHGMLEVIRYENFDVADGSGGRVANFMVQMLNERTNLMFGRAQARALIMTFDDAVRPCGIFPVYVVYGGHQEQVTWKLIRSWNGHDLIGPVAATNIWGVPQTLSNNILWLENVNLLIQHDLNFGWARTGAVMTPEAYVPGWWDDDFNRVNSAAYGDPGLLPWYGIPEQVHIVCSDHISPSSRLFEAQVLTDELDNPVDSALVTLYFPGDAPSPDAPEWVDYDGMQTFSSYSDADGWVRLSFPEGTTFSTNTPMLVTATGRRIKPAFVNGQVSIPNAELEVGDYTFTEVNGNGDRLINPGERWGITLSVRNIGDGQTVTSAEGTASSGSAYVTVSGDTAWFGDIQPEDEVPADRMIFVDIHNDAPDGASQPTSVPRLSVTLFGSGDLWHSAIELPISSPHFVPSRLLANNPIPTDPTELSVEIKNDGFAPAPALVGRLVSLSPGILVLQDSTTYAAIAVGRSMRPNGDAFSVTATLETPFGVKAPMLLLLQTNSGFIDTVRFELTVGAPSSQTPQGPDNYGYYCLDNTDQDWPKAPSFDWREIDPRIQGSEEGAALPFEGFSPQNIGEAILVELPFSTQFYGHSFNQISVATNGFITPGNQVDITNFQNWPLDRAIGGGAGMISPFWDHLTLGQTGKVFTLYDADQGLFIIEWSRMRHYSGGRVDLSFEVILYDHDRWHAESGDQPILFQYMSIRDEMVNNWGTDVPYCSVGISSPDGSSGINYAFANRYPATSAPLQNRRAILFTTTLRVGTGLIYGQVSDALTGLPIPNALITSSGGGRTGTDGDGHYRLEGLNIGESFSLTARERSHYDCTLDDMRILNENDSTEANFRLDQPVVDIEPRAVQATLESGRQSEQQVALINAGNGPVDWRAELITQNQATPAWHVTRMIDVDAAGAFRLFGAVFADNHYYVSGSRGDYANFVYVLSRAGDLVDSIRQAGSTRYGYRDLDWDGELIWAAESDSVYAFTLDGEIRHRWRAPFNSTYGIACDTTSGHLFLSGSNTNIEICDRNGNLEGESISRHGLNIFGLAYSPLEHDPHCLYVMAANRDTVDVFRLNPADGDTDFVCRISDRLPGQMLSGIGVTGALDLFSETFLTTARSPDEGTHQIAEVRVGANGEWLRMDPYQGSIAPGARNQISLILNASQIPDTSYTAELRITYQPGDFQISVDVTMSIYSIDPPRPFGLLTPQDGDSLRALPQVGDSIHFPEVEFSWQRALDDSGEVTYSLLLANGNAYRRFNTADTTCRVSFDTLALNLAFGTPLIWSVSARGRGGVTRCITPFSLVITPDDTNTRPAIPQEWDLGDPYPNPFNSAVTIPYQVGTKGYVRMVVFDLTGRLAQQLVDRWEPAGSHSVVWQGVEGASGVYLIRLEAGGRVLSRKVVQMK